MMLLEAGSGELDLAEVTATSTQPVRLSQDGGDLGAGCWAHYEDLIHMM
jgi:hypothetical protein